MNIKNKKVMYEKKSKKKFNQKSLENTAKGKEPKANFISKDNSSKPKVEPSKSILKKNKYSKESFGTDEKSKKKTFKRKSDGGNEETPQKKVKDCEMKFKDRKLMRKQKDEKFDVVTHLKKLWEELRRDDCAVDRKTQLLTQICGFLKGRVKEFVYAHDTVRVLECIVMEGTEEHRSLLFEELKDDVILMSKSKYAKFFLLKMLKYGSKKQKEAIMNAFQGSVTKLVKHTEAAEVVEMAFNECANAVQRFQMIQEFYGSSYRLFKESNVHNLAELLEKRPETKASVISSMKEELIKVLGKSVVKHSLVHHVLLQFFLNCDPTSRSDIIESLNEVVPEILHTKDGSRVAMHCVWHGTNKDRKVIIKHMKTFVKKIAMEEHGHMVLLALFDCVDDTKLIEKIIIKEIQESILEISQSKHGKKVLVYLLNPRDPHFFHPDIINILKGGDGNINSKKDTEIRQQELKVAIANPVTELIVKNIAELYKDNAFCLLTVTILKHSVGDKTKAYESIVKLAAEPYNSETKNIHIIENSGSFFMLKQLIQNDVNSQTDDNNTVTFSEFFVNNVPDGVMKTWYHCNRGAFILVNLLETKIPAVVEKIKTELIGCKKQLDKLGFIGAAILKKKLKE